MTQTADSPQRQSLFHGARTALVLLLAINLFNYVDRYVLAALEKPIADSVGAGMDKMGLLVLAFLLSYMVLSPVFGIAADRTRRWLIIGCGVIFWSLASGGTGFATSYSVLFFMRCLIGVGEAAYGPVAPTIIADLYPIEKRGKVLAWFYAAIPVGSALGYSIGGLFHDHWHWAFFCTVPPGILLGLWCFFMPEPQRKLIADGAKPHKPNFSDYLKLLKIKSYVLNSLGMTAMTFAIGGISFWMPRYMAQDRGLDPARSNMIFGAIVAAAGLFATLAGGWAGDKLRSKLPGSYMLVSAGGMIVGFPLFLLMLKTPFPLCWVVIFLACFCLFFNTGPANTALANVVHPSIRATAFAINIFIIHAFGDAISPAAIGKVAELSKTETSSGLAVGFIVVSGMMLVGGILWLIAAKFLPEDERRAEVGSWQSVGSSQ